MKHESRVGEKLVLWRTEFSLSAYKDQFGIPHKGYVVLEEHEVTIVEEREVPCMWDRNETDYGYRATNSNGKEFTCNWESFPDDSTTPMYYWNIEQKNENWFQWVDAIQACNYFLHVDKDGSRKYPINSTLCNKHNIAYFDYCWKCKWLKEK